MSEIDPFEFECEGERMRFAENYGNEKEIWIEVPSNFTERGWTMAWRMSLDSSTGIRALLAERTRRNGVFARLVEVARGINGVEDWPVEAIDAVNTQIDALQSEWHAAPGETEGGA